MKNISDAHSSLSKAVESAVKPRPAFDIIEQLLVCESSFGKVATKACSQPLMVPTGSAVPLTTNQTRDESFIHGYGHKKGDGGS